MLTEKLIKCMIYCIYEGKFRQHMYPEQVKQIQLNTPCAERELNISLVAETSEIVFFPKL